MSASLKADFKAANIPVLLGFTQVLPLILIKAPNRSGQKESFLLETQDSTSDHMAKT